MPRLLLITGQHSSSGQPNSSIQQALPIVHATLPNTDQLEQHALNQAVVIPGELSNIGHATRHILKVQPAHVIEDVQQVTAYFTNEIPIPWFHGNQRMQK